MKNKTQFIDSLLLSDQKQQFLLESVISSLHEENPLKFSTTTIFLSNPIKPHTSRCNILLDLILDPFKNFTRLEQDETIDLTRNGSEIFQGAIERLL